MIEIGFHRSLQTLTSCYYNSKDSAFIADAGFFSDQCKSLEEHMMEGLLGKRIKRHYFLHCSLILALGKILH